VGKLLERRRKMNQKFSWKKLFVHLILFAGLGVTIFPFLWMVLTSFKTSGEAMQIPPTIFPKKFITVAYTQIVSSLPFARIYFNTILSTVITVVAQLLFCAMAGYAFARLRFPGRDLAFSLVLFQMMVPNQVFLIPQYLMVSKMGMLNTIFALVFPGLVTAFGTFLLRQGFMGLPKDLEEAARLDGCNIGQTFLFVMMPLMRSSMVALGIFTALFAYKDLMWPMIVNTDKDMLVLSSALAKMQGQYVVKFPELMAASLIACVPMIVLYILFQKQFIEGIATSGGKL